MMELKCAECGLTPCQLSEYADEAEHEGITPDEYVRREEGTFNRVTGNFWCTECYCKIGMPLGTA